MTEEKKEESRTRALPKVMQGVVIRLSMAKTIVVQVETRKKHRLYKKTVRRRKNYLVHNESLDCKIGDVVEMMHTRPISKRKRWRVTQIVQKAV